MAEDVLLNSPSEALITISDTRSIVNWDDNKKKEFILTFKQRTDVALFILEATAEQIRSKAESRRFISYKHRNMIQEVCPHYFTSGGHYYNDVSGRSAQELRRIAEERADEIIKKLPSINTAVKIIDAATFALIEKHTALQEELQKKKDKLYELADEINLNDLNQDMTIGTFRRMVKKLESDREKLIAEVTSEGKELQELDITISKKLYAGIPGISEAIVKVINEHYERITALQAMTRRVEEHINFGDSKEALDMLSHFEKDEVTVSDTIKAEFDAALDKLKLSKVKKLSAKKK
jgi:uncharacterized protein YoxC